MAQNQTEVVLITGASGGIGKAVAEKFAQNGYRVALHYHNGKERAEALQQELEVQGCTVMTVQADLRESSQAEAMIKQIEQQWGSVDVLVNNAGVAQQKLFTDITDEEWRNMFAIHVDGAFYCSRAVLPGMIYKKKGSIINVSSMWGQVGGSCEVHYSAAKAGVIGFTKALAKEVAPSNIRVNCVAPGIIKTDMLNDFTKEDLAQLAEETPLERLGAPCDIAEAVSFLVSDKAKFIIGQVLSSNGGFVI